VRRKLAIAVAGLGIAASFVPLQQASASCVTAYYLVTGDCSPCDEIHYAVDNVLHELGLGDGGTQCLA
jgi:hypothetical protein